MHDKVSVTDAGHSTWGSVAPPAVSEGCVPLRRTKITKRGELEARALDGASETAEGRDLGFQLGSEILKVVSRTGTFFFFVFLVLGHVLLTMDARCTINRRFFFFAGGSKRAPRDRDKGSVGWNSPKFAAYPVCHGPELCRASLRRCCGARRGEIVAGEE